MWSGEETDKPFKQLPDRIMYGQKYGPKLVKNAQNGEKQEWKNEKPKLDNVRQLGGIYYYKETLKKMRGEYWKDLWRQLWSAKEKLGAGNRKVAAEEVASQKVPKNFSWL